MFVKYFLNRICPIFLKRFMLVMSGTLWCLQLKFIMLDMLCRCNIKSWWVLCNMPFWLSSLCRFKYMFTMPIDLLFELKYLWALSLRLWSVQLYGWGRLHMLSLHQLILFGCFFMQCLCTTLPSMQWYFKL
jgi:hypothetical protein